MFYPPSPQLPERMRAGTGFIPGELVAPDTITVCVGETIDIDLGAVDSIEGLPPGLSIISNRYLQGVFSEAFCDNITIIDQQQNRKVVRVVAIDAGVFTPRPSNITPGTTFPELEGNYSSACGIVTFSAKIRRRYIRNYRYALGSHDPLLWNGDRLYDHINNQLVRFTPPTPNNEEVTRDATASPVTISNDLRISSLGPIDNTGSQYIYFIEDNRIKRATLDGTVTTLTSSDLQYYRGAAFIPRPTSGSDTITDGQLVPHAIAANTNRIYVFCSIVGSDYGVDNSKWWEYELNWATLQDGIVQVYDLNGALQTSECVEGIRISGTADLPFSLSSRGVTFTLASWSAARIGSNASETKRPGVFATDDAIYVLAVQGTFQHQNDHLFLLRFPIRNGVMTRDSDKSLLIDGIHRNIQGLYRSPEGDFYFGTVTPDALAHLGGQETRGLIKIPSSEFNRDGTLILHSTETIDIEPPVGQFIENCVGTVSNTRGEASVVANAHVTDTPDNKIRITFPVDYATESEVYVTGQYQLRE